MKGALNSQTVRAIHLKKVSENDREIPQLHTAELPTHRTVRKSHRTLTVTRHQSVRRLK